MFSTIHEQPPQVIDRYLKGVPYKNDFPGPFNPQGSLPGTGPPMSMPLQPTKTPRSCTQYGNQIPFVVPPTKMPSEAVFPKSRVEGFKDISMTDPQNETGFGQVVPVFQESRYSKECPPWTPDGPLVDIKNRPVDQFSHNNMVPYYGANVTQNMHSTGVPQAGGDNSQCHNAGYANVTPNRGILEGYTGRDESYMHKRETGPLFSPAEQQTGWVYGTPAFRPNLDQYKQSIRIRNNEAPIEKLQVGPGIATDYSVPAIGGFHQFARILPNNVSDYKANQLEGRVGGGKWQYSNKPTAQFTEGVPNNRPKEYMTQARRPTMQGKFYANAQSAGATGITNQTILAQRGKQGRSETEVAGGYGQLERTDGSSYCVSYGDSPVGKVMGSTVPKITQDRGSYAEIREPFKKWAAGTTVDGNYWECKDMTQGQNRWDLLGGGHLPVTQPTVHEGWYVNETDRGDANPYVINATGTLFGGQWNPLSFTDQQKVTRKETTQYAYQGNPNGGETKTTSVLFTDQPKVTRKETTQYAYQGNTGGRVKSTNVFFDDQPKVTRKETTQFAHHGNALGGHAQNTSRWSVTGGN